MKLKLEITVLADNTVWKKGLLAEHGLSLWLRTPEWQMLYDTGQGLTAVFNAGALQKNWKELQGVILSHGHYDHVGGLELLARHLPLPMEVFAHPGVLAARYRRRQGVLTQTGGFWKEGRLRELGLLLSQGREPREIRPGLLLSGEIKRDYRPERQKEGFYCLRDGELVPDDFIDDQAALLETPAGLTVICGCAHAGVLNTVQHAKRLMGKPVSRLVGGLHLLEEKEHIWEETAVELASLGVESVYWGHCTGPSAGKVLEKHIPGSRGFSVGDLITLE